MSFYAPFYITDVVVENSPDSLIFLKCSTNSCTATAIFVKYRLIPIGDHSCDAQHLNELPIKVCPPAIIDRTIKKEIIKRELRNLF